MKIALIGYGEVGTILAEDLRRGGHEVSAYDLKLDRPAGDPMRAHADGHGVRLAVDHRGAVAGVGLVVSAVTASQAEAAATSCAAGLAKGAFFLDLNSASPGARHRAAGIVDDAGACYVEGAVMAPVPPYRLRMPLLLGGRHAAALQPVIAGLGFAPTVASDRLGAASASKMCRSVMVKGLEAMVIEAFTTARHYGVEEQVLASLRETYPGINWEKLGAYVFQRVIEHGRRRAEEMREAAETVREAGLTPWSAAGAAERQAWVADRADENCFGPRGTAAFARSADWRTEADRILEGVRAR
jgi:3-hydroxyisobutyrate dehydrogenase-like beta-hydroxyacid dehydrogenase